MYADKVVSMTEHLENEKTSRLSAEQQAHDASVRVDVLSSYFNEKEKEFDRYYHCVQLYFTYFVI